MSQIPWENVRMQDGLPISARLHKSDEATLGCELHWHEELELYYVVSGGVSLLSGGRRAWLHPGDVGFVPWCEPHRGDRFLHDTQHYIFQISGELLAQEVLLLPGGAQTDLLSLFAADGRAFPLALRDPKGLCSLLDSVLQELVEQPYGFQLRLKGLTLEILAWLLRESPSGSQNSHRQDQAKRLRELLVYLSAHCTQPEQVSLPALSRRFGLSVPYLCRVFKNSTNLTLTNYVNELRCQRAASLLQNGATLEEASASCGFADYNYFSRLFKRVMGAPPSVYKRQTRQGTGLRLVDRREY